MRILTEKETEDFLEKNKFKVIKRAFIESKEQLGKIKLKFPLAIKIHSEEISHKKEIGGIFLNIKNFQEAEKAFEKLKQIKGFQGILVQEMIKGDEFILGLKKTPEFGIVVMVGAGGSEVEKLKDIVFRIFPIKKNDAEEMLNELKIKTNNPDEVKKNILKMSNLAKKYPNIKELDINPLIVNKKDAVVVDARTIM